MSKHLLFLDRMKAFSLTSYSMERLTCTLTGPLPHSNRSLWRLLTNDGMNDWNERGYYLVV